MKTKTLSTLALAVLTAGGLAASANAQSITIDTVMSGLNNPRGITIGPDGSLYVAEAGIGGGSSAPSFVDGNQATVFFGDTGGVSVLKNGVQTRLIGDLPSVAAPNGSGAGGLTHLTFASDGNAYGVINFGGEGAARTTLIGTGAVNAQLLGTVVKLNLGSSPSATLLTDVTGYAVANGLEGPTQPGKPAESNPYGLTALKGGGFAATDAGGNYIATIADNGTVTGNVQLPNYHNSSFPGFGPPTSQAVPTSITEGADGTLYVSELGGFPFTPGDAHIDVIKNGALVSRLGGFTTLVDVTYYDGELYGLQFSTNGLASPNPGPGELLEIDPLTGKSKVLYSGLFLPGGLAVEDQNTFFITTGSVLPGGGSVIRLTVPEPGSASLFISLGVAGIGLLARRRIRK